MEKTNVYKGLCACGCGQATTVPQKTDISNGVIAGVPRRFCKGHNANRKRHGMYRSVEHRAFRAARSRCNNPKDTSFKNYGGRGIKFLFESFEAFFAEIGTRPSDMHSVDRIKVNGNYEQGNIRWATPAEQRANLRPGILKGKKPSAGSFKKGHVGYGKGVPLSPRAKENLSQKLKAAHIRRPGSWRKRDGKDRH